MNKPKGPNKEQVRQWTFRRHTEHEPLPDMEQIKHELGWKFADSVREKNFLTGTAMPSTSSTTAPTATNLFQPKGKIIMSKRDIYIAKMKLQLDALNAAMSELEIKAQEAKQDARDQYESEMSKLRAQSQLALDKLDELKSAGENSWETLVAEADKVRDAFTHSFHYFKSQL